MAGRRALQLVLVALLAAACEKAAPPVTSTYRSVTITLYYSEEAEMWVDIMEEAGQPVTVTGTIYRDGRMLRLFEGAGHIDAESGLFIASEGGLNDREPLATDDPRCGRRRWVGGSLVFRGDQAFFGAILDTAICGQITYRATLTKMELEEPLVAPR